MNEKTKIACIVFPKITQLDITGPFEVFARAEGFEPFLVSKTKDPVRAESGLLLTPDYSFSDCPDFQILCIPGGSGINETLNDPEYLDFVKERSKSAKWITSVCTGSLLLGSAGLLNGYKATTHWRSLPFLEKYGAIPVAERFVFDRNRVTGGGITAGIDFGLALVSKILGEKAAQEIQLMLEYNPKPPFHSGSAQTAPADVLKSVLSKTQAGFETRKTLVKESADRLQNS